jgi:hypothetical protein
MDGDFARLFPGRPGRHWRRRLRWRDLVSFPGLGLEQPEQEHPRQAQAEADDAQSRVKRGVGLQAADRSDNS